MTGGSVGLFIRTARQCGLGLPILHTGGVKRCGLKFLNLLLIKFNLPASNPLSSFIESEKHFINYLARVIKNVNLDLDKLLPKEFYIESIYNKGLADRYTWELKHNPTLVKRDQTLRWLRKRSNKIFFDRYDHILTQSFLDTVEDLGGIPGIYSFWTPDRIPLYIGRSKSLGSRIPKSLEKCKSMNQSIFLRYIRTKTVPDTVVLEAYYITKLSPALNREGYFDGELSEDLQLKNPPKFGGRTKCTIVREENAGDSFSSKIVASGSDSSE